MRKSQYPHPARFNQSRNRLRHTSDNPVALAGSDSPVICDKSCTRSNELHCEG